MLIVFIQLVGEKSEVYFAIMSVLPEMGMVFKLELARMLQHEDAVVGQDIGGEDKVGNLAEVLQRIRRVGKDDVETLVCPLKQVEDIGAHRPQIGHLELQGSRLDEVDALGRRLPSRQRDPSPCTLRSPRNC